MIVILFAPFFLGRHSTVRKHRGCANSRRDRGGCPITIGENFAATAVLIVCPLPIVARRVTSLNLGSYAGKADTPAGSGGYDSQYGASAQPRQLGSSAGNGPRDSDWGKKKAFANRGTRC